MVFAGTGLILIVAVSLIEYFSWLTSSQRLALFFITAGIELVLLFYYIVWPGLQLFISGKALSDYKAAKLIGKKLPGIKDKLTNYLELKTIANRSDLIDAGLNQKQLQLSNYSFKSAISFKELKPFSLFLIPIVVLFVFLSQGNSWFMVTEGAERLLNFNTHFEKELPFVITLNNDLSVKEGEDFLLEISLSGNVIPDELIIESAQGKKVISRSGINMYTTEFKNCIRSVSFRFIYDDIPSKEYRIEVIKKPVVGRVSVLVSPPAYTNLSPYKLENEAALDVPQYSKIQVGYAFKNTNRLLALKSSNGIIDTLLLDHNQVIEFKIESTTKISAYSNEDELNKTQINTIVDKRPLLEVTTDSLNESVLVGVKASDDYAIKNAYFIFKRLDGKEEKVSLPYQGALLKSTFEISVQELNTLESVSVVVFDDIGKSSKTIDLKRFKQKEKSEKDLLSEAGSEIDEFVKEHNEEKSDAEKNKIEKSKKKALEKLNEQSKELTKKDSLMYQRFEKLSEEILKLADDLEKNIPETQKKIKEQKLEDKIEELEKEWQILKTIEKLKSMEDSLKTKDGAIDANQMQEIQQSAKELKEKLLEEEEKKQVDWDKFENLKKSNNSLDKEVEKQKDSKSSDEEIKDSKSKEDDLKDDMKKDSEALRQQLSEMSDLMMMEAMEKNIELLRRLEIRALKNSLNQEKTYLLASEQMQIDNKVGVSQNEINTSAKVILDSLSYLTISDEELAQVLLKNQETLEKHLVEMQRTDVVDVQGYISSQRYLQYGLNDLAAILYDILKQESKSLMDAKSGDKQCKNPKPGKGKKPGKSKKPSLSQQQKELGEKMGNKPKPGKGKPGKQSMSQSELLELIKGQEQIIEQYEQKGGSKAGDSELSQELNKQLDDLINNNLEKALLRNKDIEDKLITLEESENSKKELQEKRQSKENELDYESLKNAIIMDYIKRNQRGSSVVNLPALKNYFTGKWVTINQE